jgi:23S rRNA pseudouridine1911/1915/1917 synthase
LIKEAAVLVDGKKVKPRHALVEGESIQTTISQAGPGEIQGEAIEIDIIFEDEDIVVVNKSHGLVVHPASGNLDGTLVNALMHHCKGDLCRIAGDDRPGIVHRLDKDTSGCLVAVKNENAYHSLVAQFSGRETGKIYRAVVSGVPANEGGTLISQIGRHPVNRKKMAVVKPPAGKEAITDYRVLGSDSTANWASVECIIHTGRTHQIRVHLKECLHCPILGDPVYGQPRRQKVQVNRLMLHASQLSFNHPVTSDRMTFNAPLPDEFLAFE